MADEPITVIFHLAHASRDSEEIEASVESLRRRAVEMGFSPVGRLDFILGDSDILTADFGIRFLHPDLISLAPLPLAICSFTFALPDCDQIEIGLSTWHADDEDQDINPTWRWSGTVITRHVGLFTDFLKHGTTVGIESTITHYECVADEWKGEAGSGASE